MSTVGKQVFTTLESDGTLTVEVAETTFPEPKGAQVLVRMEAAPINPSDLALLFRPLVGLGLIVVRHAFLEALQPLRDVTHHVGKALATEQEQHEYREKDPVNEAETAHGKAPG